MVEGFATTLGEVPSLSDPAAEEEDCASAVSCEEETFASEEDCPADPPEDSVGTAARGADVPSELAEAEDPVEDPGTSALVDEVVEEAGRTVEELAVFPAREVLERPESGATGALEPFSGYQLGK